MDAAREAATRAAAAAVLLAMGYTDADATALAVSRRRILDLQPSLIVPGHGPAFAPSATTPV